MLEGALVALIVVIVLAVLFDFANGFNDAANAIATVVSTRVLTPTAAVIMAATMNFIGALTGTAVAKVVGAGIVAPGSITLLTVAAGVGAAALWVFLASKWGIPVSGSHSLIAGMVGAAVATGGTGTLLWDGINKTLIGLAFAPLIGFGGGFVLMVLIYWGFRRVALGQVNGIFSKLQIVSAAFMAFSHGSNDAQKTMGVISLAVAVYAGWEQQGIPFHIPLWVVILSATVMAAGTYAGGWNVVHTLGVKMVALRPVNGFVAETAAATLIEAGTRLGFPLSTTHVITSTIVGQGATRRLSAVRWAVAKGIVVAWIVTFPFCVVAGALFVYALKVVFPS